MVIPVIISCHRSDLEVAKALRATLERLSDRFSVFLEVERSFEQTGTNKSREAEWLLILSSRLPRSDADIMWSFYEAGYFRAKLRDVLVAEANRRIVFISDDEPPQMLSRFRSVKVSVLQSNGIAIDPVTIPARDNSQFDGSAIYRLLEEMLENSPLAPLRDVSDITIRELLREESSKLIGLFASPASSEVSPDSVSPRQSVARLRWRPDELEAVKKSLKNWALSHAQADEPVLVIRDRVFTPVTFYSAVVENSEYVDFFLNYLFERAEREGIEPHRLVGK